MVAHALPLTVLLLACAAGCASRAPGEAPSTTPEVAPGSSAEPQQSEDLSELEWLLGTWVARNDDGRVAEERWQRQSDDAFTGTSSIRERDNGALIHDESLRLEQRDDGIYYVASPADQSTAAFKLVQSSGDNHSRRWAATFENLEHDFPQRIRYEREGEVLRAVVESADGSKRLSFIWRRRDGAAS